MSVDYSVTLLELALLNGTFFERLATLAEEYHAKTITPERFANRVYEMVYAHDKLLREKLDETLPPPPKEKV